MFTLSRIALHNNTKAMWYDMSTYPVTLHFRDRHGVFSLCFYVWTLRYGFRACAEAILAIRYSANIAFTF